MALAEQTVVDLRSEDLCGKKICNRNFSGQDLSKLKLRRSLFFRCNFDGADLSEADCEGSEFFGSSFVNTNCYRTNFKHAKLAGTIFKPKDLMEATITLSCKTFDSMELSQIWWFAWLYFATLMKPERQPVKEDLRDNLIASIGAERYAKLHALFSKRDV